MHLLIMIAVLLHLASIVECLMINAKMNIKLLLSVIINPTYYLSPPHHHGQVTTSPKITIPVYIGLVEQGWPVVMKEVDPVSLGRLNMF